jgi:hypothetical protein
MGILAECPACRKKQSVKNKMCKCGANLDKAKGSRTVNYWIDYYLPGGKRRRELSGTSIDDARDANSKRRSQKKEGKFYEMLPDEKLTFSQLTEWFLAVEENRALAGEICDDYLYVKRLNIASFNAVYGDMVVSNIKRRM